ncbi:MAG: L-serine ammonia-lyase, iron-sulfur-dependent, subunit alpha [Aminobacterium sp.]|jgi:L-cysteine desulfidase|nr:L-serine ammonia-lyase, iron-sulfur-dependent, subunit alpha [Aminobacterium sp.]MDD3707935.1 L-serine ammonia-lyase, iron-sulfur-dependent, subunit alpha [Aminobacterium sp.]MDD4229461.1 L-serine ammonia-lyase, iron-sulfur-dependent, subunit alpha [Aminobacterium sp.]MDD4550991.1 L-serine ammonia-lyase, iron-sulfur-dependent, subunit alpha [Aminobacterium sp.]
MISLKKFLKEEVKPALGCTEPGAVALAVARATEELHNAPVDSIKVLVSGNIFKNGMSVGIPGTNGLRGNTIAAALAALCGKSALGLEVLKNSTENDVQNAQKMVSDGKVQVLPDADRNGIYVKADVKSKDTTATCTIEGSHTGIVEVTLNNDVVFSTKSNNSTDKAETKKELSAAQEISQMPFSSVVALVQEMDDEDVAYALKGAEMNMTIAEQGFDENQMQGLEVGKTLRKSAADWKTMDHSLKIRAISAAASDARMAGAPYPVMSSAGSGNHGITAILPIYILGRELGKSDREIAEGIIYSHLCTSFVKSRMGRLSPVCGCAVAAGAGAAGGLVHLMGGSEVQAAKAMELVLGNLVGMLCDGAKETCALKVGTGAFEAVQAAELVMNGHHIEMSQGVINEKIEDTVANVVAVNAKGMRDVDRIILDIMASRTAC